MKSFNILFAILLMSCGNIQTFPSEIKMDCTTPYGDLATTVFVDGSIISYSINETMTFVITKNARYFGDLEMRDGDILLIKLDQYLLLADGVECHG